ncbi:hypothetical protein AX14_007066 [Amanita brunnescens Koide BX004]|nr:hypothetical protein AX14_007066 [Amanita brunnescens Koide BX004]
MWAKPYIHLLEQHIKEWMDNPSADSRERICKTTKQEIMEYRNKFKIRGPIPIEDALTEVVQNWLNNNKPKGQGRRKDHPSLSLKVSGTSKSPSKTPTTPGVNTSSSNEIPSMAPLKTNRITLKAFKREDIILGLHGDEIKTQATLKCNGNKGGFAWLNKCHELAKKKIFNMSAEELHKIDNEVQRWNDRELPPFEQAKHHQNLGAVMKEFLNDISRVYGVQMLCLAFFPHMDQKMRFSKFVTEPIRGTDRFMDLPSWNQDACYNFQMYCYKQFRITDPDDENDDEEQEQNEEDYESQHAIFSRDKDGYAVLPPYKGMQHMSLIRDYTTINYHKLPL